MAELYWAMPDFCLGVDAPAEMFEFKTGRIETDSICFKLPHTGLPNLECNLREGGVFLLIAHAGPTARHTEDEGLPEFNFKGLTNLEQGCMNYKLYPEGLLIGNAGYYSFYKVQANNFSGNWKVTCPYSKKSRYFSFVGNREEKKISLSYALRTL
jgi:hypothetical protein